jgi:alanyl-tRNA synthetase
MTPEQIVRVEDLVNRQILANEATAAQVMAFDDAVKGGAMALFGEKYGDTVRVLDIGFSRELCGGTHVRRTGDIGLFKITAESGVAAGVRRVEAITGENALHWVQQLSASANQVAALVKSTVTHAPDRVAQLQDQVKLLERELDQARAKLSKGKGSALADRAQTLDGGVKVLIESVEGADPKSLRAMVDQLKDKLACAVVLLATVADGKVSLVAGVTPDVVDKIKAGDLVGHVAQLVAGKGGGRPDMAMGGGTDPDGLPAALQSATAWAREQLGAH